MYTEEELVNEEINRRVDEICYLLSSLQNLFDENEWKGVRDFKDFIRSKRNITQPILRKLVMGEEFS